MPTAPADDKKEKEIHRLFDITLLLKGIHAGIELFGGVLLYLISASNIAGIGNFFLNGELIEDPHDIVANYLLNAAQGLGGSAKTFAALYLVSHGVVNGLVVLGLWKEKMWAYPISFAVIGAFIAYQLYLLTFGYSLWLVILTVLDAAILFLAWHEYTVLKNGR
jgi:uncharacterized membrane protein